MAWYDELLSGAQAVGSGLLDAGETLGKGYMAYKAPAMYRGILEAEQRARNQKERSLYNQEFLGQQATPAVAGMQAGPTGYVPESLQQSQPTVAGSGIRGGNMSPMEVALKAMGSPDAITRTGGNAMMRDQMQPKGPSNSSVTFDQYRGYDDQTRTDYDKYKGRNKKSPLVSINTGDKSGHWATNQELKGMDVGAGKKVWMHPTSGPQIKSGMTDKQVASGVTADGIVKNLGRLDASLGPDYLPNMKDNLTQFGLPDSVNNLFRSSDGRKYLSTYNSMVADVVKDITGAASTDPEYKRLYSLLAYVTGDEGSDMKHKRQLLDVRIDQMYAKSGKKRPQKVQERQPDGNVISASSELKSVDDMTLEEIEAELAGD